MRTKILICLIPKIGLLDDPRIETRHHIDDKRGQVRRHQTKFMRHAGQRKLTRYNLAFVLITFVLPGK